MWKEMHKIQGQGYMTLGYDDSPRDDDIPQQTPGVSLGDDQGGRPLIQTDDDEPVRLIRFVYHVFLLMFYFTRSTMILAK